MSHADKRSPVTDALETLGMIHFKPEARDAIHLAVEPVKAVQDLQPGQRIGIINSEALPAGTKLCLQAPSLPLAQRSHTTASLIHFCQKAPRLGNSSGL